jgi:hypothetical protein
MLMTQAVIDKMNAMITAPIQEEMPGLEPNADVAKGNNQYRRSNLFLKSSQAERDNKMITSMMMMWHKEPARGQ